MEVSPEVEIEISVALALYRPNRKYLAEQLHSLVLQGCQPDELLVWNDSPDELDAESVLRAADLPFPWRVYKDGSRHGVTSAFERLTKEAKGKYLAYCDQDDIWTPDKLAIMKNYMEAHPDCLCCHAAVRLINSRGDRIGVLYTQPLAVLNDASWQTYHFLRENQTLGCAMLVRTTAARAALPFPRRSYHDQWIALWCLFHERGEGFRFLREELLLHRIHRGHASTRLAGITCRRAYYEKKLAKDGALLREVTSRLPGASSCYVADCRWLRARRDYAAHPGLSQAWRLWRQRKLRPQITYFELLLPWFPSWLLRHLLQLLRRGRS